MYIENCVQPLLAFRKESNQPIQDIYIYMYMLYTILSLPFGFAGLITTAFSLVLDLDALLLCFYV